MDEPLTISEKGRKELVRDDFALAKRLLDQQPALR
jgi:hypothetical protein